MKLRIKSVWSKRVSYFIIQQKYWIGWFTIDRCMTEKMAELICERIINKKNSPRVIKEYSTT